MRTSASLAVLALAVGVMSLACSSSPSAQNFPTSFSGEVVPILQSKCSTSGGACHGATNVTTQMQPRPYLGPETGTPDTPTLAMIHDGIVNQPSGELPTMPYVTPKDTTKSYL